MNFLPRIFSQPNPPTSTEKFVDGIDQKLRSTNDYINKNKLGETFLNRIDVITGLFFAALQLFLQPLFTIGGLITGGLIKFGCKQSNYDLPRNLTSLTESIEEIWSNKGIRAASFIVGMILLYSHSTYVAIASSVTTGAYISSKI